MIPASVFGEGHQAALPGLEGRKVIFLLGCLELGGAERQAMLLARWLKERCGARVEVWGVAHGGSLTRHCDELGVPWRVTGNPFVPGLLSTAKRLAAIAWQLRQAGGDVLLPYTLVPNVIAGMTWRISGARVCIWNQRDEGIEGRRDPFQEWALRLTPAFIANSKACAGYLTGVLKVDPGRVSVVHNGLALAPPAEGPEVWRRRLGLSREWLCVSMIGHLSDKKDHATLIRAWRQVLDALPPHRPPLKLVLAGRHDGEAKGLLELVASLGLADRVLFAGEVSDVAGLLAVTDIAAYSSRSEGLPNGVLECMAAGRAVVATDIPGIREALGEGYPFLVSPGDPAGMAARLLDLIGSPEIRLNVGNENMRRACTLFGADAMCAGMTQIIAELLR